MAYDEASTEEQLLSVKKNVLKSDVENRLQGALRLVFTAEYEGFTPKQQDDVPPSAALELKASDLIKDEVAAFLKRWRPDPYEPRAIEKSELESDSVLILNGKDTSVARHGVAHITEPAISALSWLTKMDKACKEYIDLAGKQSVSDTDSDDLLSSKKSELERIHTGFLSDEAVSKSLKIGIEKKYINPVNGILFGHQLIR